MPTELEVPSKFPAASKQLMAVSGLALMFLILDLKEGETVRLFGLSVESFSERAAEIFVTVIASGFLVNFLWLGYYYFSADQKSEFAELRSAIEDLEKSYDKIYEISSKAKESISEVLTLVSSLKDESFSRIYKRNSNHSESFSQKDCENLDLNLKRARQFFQEYRQKHISIDQLNEEDRREVMSSLQVALHFCHVVLDDPGESIVDAVVRKISRAGTDLKSLLDDMEAVAVSEERVSAAAKAVRASQFRFKSEVVRQAVFLGFFPLCLFLAAAVLNVSPEVRASLENWTSHEAAVQDVLQEPGDGDPVE